MWRAWFVTVVLTAAAAAAAANPCLQDNFNSVSARAGAELSHRRQLQQLQPLPDQDTARFAMLMMLHGAGWPNHELWEQWQQQHEQGEITLMVHLKVGLAGCSIACCWICGSGPCGVTCDRGHTDGAPLMVLMGMV
jgi:hypothetical protein